MRVSWRLTWGAALFALGTAGCEASKRKEADPAKPGSKVILEDRRPATIEEGAAVEIDEVVFAPDGATVAYRVRQGKSNEVGSKSRMVLGDKKGE